MMAKKIVKRPKKEKAKEEKDYGTIKTKERPYDKEKYTIHAKNSTRILYWLTLLILVVFNFLIFLLFAVLAFFMDALQTHVAVAGIGLVFGLIFNFLILDLEHLEPKHHLAAALLIPLVATINLFIMTFIVNLLRDIWGLPLTGGALTESIIYVVFFIGPFLYSLFTGKIK